MANDAQMPERVWATPEEAELLQPEDGFNPADQGMTEYVRSDLCASGQQVRALEWKDDAPFFDDDPDSVIYSEAVGAGYTYIAEAVDCTLEEAKAACQAEFERRILAALTPAPQVDAEHCGCGDKACLACFHAATPTAQEAEPVAYPHSSHNMRFTDSSHGDEICDNCMAIDPLRGKNFVLSQTCKAAHPPQPSETVAEAAETVVRLWRRGSYAATNSAVNILDAALRALKGGDDAAV